MEEKTPQSFFSAFSLKGHFVYNTTYDQNQICTYTHTRILILYICLHIYIIMKEREIM